MNNVFKLAVPFEIRSTPEEDKGVVEGYASVFSAKDSYGSFFDKGCFQKAINENSIKVLFSHNWNEPIGRVIEAREDNYGLFVKYKLILDIPEGDKAYKLILGGALDSMSIGGYVRTEAIENDEWHIKEFDLIEVSPVIFPANKQAVITSVRGFDPRVKATEAKDLENVEAVNLIRMMTIDAQLKNINISLASLLG